MDDEPKLTVKCKTCGQECAAQRVIHRKRWKKWEFLCANVDCHDFDVQHTTKPEK